MKPIHLYVAAGLVLTAMAIPVAMTFGDQKLTDTIRQAKATVCMNTFTLCTNQCSARASSAPGSYPICMQECSQQYARCMSAIARHAPTTGSTGPTSHPSTAPPKPTPRKIAPERVTGVTTTNAGPTASPGKSISPGQRKQSDVNAGTFGPQKNSPTATPPKK